MMQTTNSNEVSKLNTPVEGRCILQFNREDCNTIWLNFKKKSNTSRLGMNQQMTNVQSLKFLEHSDEYQNRSYDEAPLRQPSMPSNIDIQCSSSKEKASLPTKSAMSL